MTLGSKLVFGAIFLFAHTFALPLVKRAPVESAAFFRSLSPISLPLDMHNFEPLVNDDDDDNNRQREVAVRRGPGEPYLGFDPLFYRKPSWSTNRYKRRYTPEWLSRLAIR